MNQTQYDIIVCGAGSAGCGAAVTAARLGAKVLIIEKTINFGGLATNGLVAWEEPLCDSQGRQVIGGIGEEMLVKTIQSGYDTIPPSWKVKAAVKEGRYAGFFSAGMMALQLMDMLTSAKVDILLDTLIVGVTQKDGVLQSVVCEEKAGRKEYFAKIFIDGTGDADVAYHLGVPTRTGTNWLSYVYHYSEYKDGKRPLGIRNAMNFAGGTEITFGDGLSAKEVTRYVLTGQKLVLEKMNKNPNKEERDVILPSQVDYRTTRHIVGDYELGDGDIDKRFDDVVVQCGYIAQPGRVLDIPVRALYNSAFPNYLACGRIISAHDTAWDISRIIPAAAGTGQAAATLAVLALKHDLSFAKVPYDELRGILVNNGAMLTYS